MLQRAGGQTFVATHSITDIPGIMTPALQTGDSYESLLADVMREIDGGLSQMTEADRSGAIAQIHAIAENVRSRQEQSAGR